MRRSFAALRMTKACAVKSRMTKACAVKSRMTKACAVKLGVRRSFAALRMTKSLRFLYIDKAYIQAYTHF